jgi:hypothetical protein
VNAALQAPHPPRPAEAVFPNFLIVGVMKAATTALSAYLNRHPNIYLPDRELHFFDRDDRYEQGSGYYRALFAPQPGERWVGEKTPTYSYHEPCAARIAAYNPEMRLIWIFRNPTERAYSHYWYFVQNGQEQLSFEEALAAEPVRLKHNVGYAYRDRGLYTVQIERFLKFFPRESMLFVLHEDFKREPEGTVARCLAFLDLPAAPGLTQNPMPENVTRQPRMAALQRLAYQYLYRRFYLGYRIIHRLNTRPQAGYPPLPASVKAELDRFYAPYNAQFAALTGLDIARWN